MNFQDHLATQQKVAYQTLYNSFSSKHLSHAYLLVGDVGSPLLETAQLIARSYTCEHPHPLACEECFTCHRMDHQTYIDFIVRDGSQEGIKKEHIEKIQEQFSKTAIEESGKKVYILHLVEKATPSAVNSLLKFLEEPVENVLAILTTQSLSGLLPTIASRCQVIRLKGYPAKQLQQDAMTLGIPPQDAAILAQFHSRSEAMKQEFDSPNYSQAKAFVIDWFDKWHRDFDNVIRFVQNGMETQFRDKASLVLVLNLFEIALKDCLRLQQGRDIIMVDYYNVLAPVAKQIRNIDDKLQKTMRATHDTIYNLNGLLLMDRLLFELYGEEDHR